MDSYITAIENTSNRFDLSYKQISILLAVLRRGEISGHLSEFSETGLENILDFLFSQVVWSNSESVKALQLCIDLCGCCPRHLDMEYNDEAYSKPSTAAELDIADEFTKRNGIGTPFSDKILEDYRECVGDIRLFTGRLKRATKIHDSLAPMLFKRGIDEM